MANKVEIQIVGNNVYAVNAIDGVKTKLGSLQTQANTTADAMMTKFKAFGAGLLTYFSVDAIGSFAKQSLKLAQDFEEVNAQFRQMPQNAYLLERLRRATQNTVSDLELMKLALEAKNFRIPIDLLAKGLEFAKLRADETGDSIDSLFNAFVTGVGKESIKSLTQLGISAKEFKEEIKLSGDYGIALGNIMTRELAKVDTSLLSSADKMEQFNAKFENLSVELGQRLIPVVNQLMEDIITTYDWWAAFLGFGPTEAERRHQKYSSYLMTTYEKQIQQQTVVNSLTEEEVVAQQKKLELIRQQQEEAQHQLNKATNKLSARGYEDIGGGVALEPMTQFYEMQKMMIDDVTDYELAALFLRSEAAAQTFGDMAGAMLNFYSMAGEGSRTFFDMYKIFAAGEAAIAAYDAATKVFAATAFMYPFNYVAAGAALTFGLSNVARILSMQPGSAPSGGGGTAPSIPRGSTINNNNSRNMNYSIVVYTSDPNLDKDRFARDIIGALRKAEDDGG